MILSLSGKAAVSDSIALKIKEEINNIQSFSLLLDGYWEFYWKEFLDYEDLQNKVPGQNRLIVEVPGYWSDYKLNGEFLPSKGYGTFRKTIILPDESERMLAFKVPVFDDSYRLYIDDVFVAGSGKPAVSESEAQPGYRPVVAVFETSKDTIDIILHVSNYHHRRGGFWQSMVLGTRTEIIKQRDIYTLVSYFSMGILLAFSIFFLFFFIFYRKNYISLFFSVVLMGILIRLFSTDSYPILLLNPQWIWLIRIEYLGSFMALAGGIWYFLYLFPSEFIKKISYVFTAFILVSVGIILAARVDVFAYTMFFFQPLSVLLLSFYLIRSLIGAVKGNSEHLIFFIAILVFTGALINDILVANSRTALSSNYIIHFAVQFFVLVHAVMIIRQWVIAFKSKEELNRQIEYINLNLEKLVKDRTSELNARNKEIGNQNKEIASKNKELQTSMEFNQKLFSIIAHDLKSPVSSIYQVSEHLYSTRDDKILKQVFKSISNLSDSALTLIDNLLFWGRSKGKNLKVNAEKIQMAPVLNEMHKFFGETAGQKEISLDFDSGGDITCFADRQLLLIILRNLISNAIKFTPSGGKVSVNVGKDPVENFVKIEVQDSGSGIPEEKINRMKEGIFPESSYGTSNEKGSGLGLPLCFELTILNSGSLQIESAIGKGTKAIISLPTAI
jgi:signal transduction histidine kinase